MKSRENTPVVRVEGASVAFGDREVLAGLDLSVARGETAALLGPNGAGKTTLIDCLQGFRRPDSGVVEVLGRAPWRAPRAWRDRIGVVLQDTRLDADLSVAEFTEMTRGWYADPRPTDELLASVDLAGLASRRVHRLSGGERRRLDLAMATVGSPELIFLDEPTAGLDPLAKHELWDLLDALGAQGTTILLTSHDLAEVERLADRVHVLHGGGILRAGSTDEIRADAESFERAYLDLIRRPAAR